LKICHVITRMIVGGAQENTLFTVIDHLKKGHEVVLVTGPSPGPEGKLLAHVDAPDFETMEIPDLVRELSPAHDAKAFLSLRKFFRERRFDVVHTHSSKAGIIGRFAARAAGVPVVVHTIHGQAFTPYEKHWRNALYKTAEFLSAKCSDRIFAVAQAMVDQCVASHIAPVSLYQVVYSGMEIERFLNAQPEPELRKELGIPENVPVIGALARLFPMKGYEYFMPGAIAVAKRIPDVHFLIIGDGILHDDLVAQAKEAGLEERFHFAGLVAPSQVQRYLAQIDLLWHLSLREGLPRSVVQVLGCGKPAIGFALDGTPEVVLNGKTGYCTAPEDVAAVVEHSCEILSCPERKKQMGEAGKALVAERFAHQRMADILETAYQELLAKSPRQ